MLFCLSTKEEKVNSSLSMIHIYNLHISSDPVMKVVTCSLVPCLFEALSFKESKIQLCKPHHDEYRDWNLFLSKMLWKYNTTEITKPAWRMEINPCHSLHKLNSSSTLDTLYLVICRIRTFSDSFSRIHVFLLLTLVSSVRFSESQLILCKNATLMIIHGYKNLIYW